MLDNFQENTMNVLEVFEIMNTVTNRKNLVNEEYCLKFCFSLDDLISYSHTIDILNILCCIYTCHL